MSLPEDVVAEREHNIAKLAARELRILARIRRALRSLVDVRRKMSIDRKAHSEAVLALAKRKGSSS